MTPTYTVPPTDPIKHATRVANLAAVRESADKYGTSLVTPTGLLRRDWLELLGPEGPTLGLLLGKRALDPTSASPRFIGVDSDPSVIRDARQRYAPVNCATFIHTPGTFVTGLDADLYQNVGVCVFDSLNKARGREVEEHLAILFDFAERQHARLGGFCLILNVTQQGVFRDARGIGRYKKLVSEHFGHEVPGEAWTEYRSESAKNPMLLTRLFWR